MSRRELGVGIIGLGFMGSTHFRAYQAAARDDLGCRVVAVCDGRINALRDITKARGNLGPSGAIADDPRIREYTDIDAFLNDADVTIVSICTYTDTHVDLALRAMRAGKHVLVEKPVAVRSEDVRRLAEAARGAQTLCMPAMCMRFWPGWDWLHDRIQEKTFGELRSLQFTRLGSGPSWSQSFYGDESRSGGALIDLHIHDVDFAYWCLGAPAAVRSEGSTMHVRTEFVYADSSIHVQIEGGWTLKSGDAFQMKYRAAFERADVTFELGRNPVLMVEDERGSHAVSLADESGYEAEIRHFVHAVHRGHQNVRATVDDAVAVAEILEAERASLQQGGAPVQIRQS